MLNINEFRSKVKALPDLLNIACMVGQYSHMDRVYAVALQKDGSLLAGLKFSGPDLESMSTQSINSLSATLNAALSRLGTGWVSHISAIRYGAGDYTAESDCYFTDSVSYLIDAERRETYKNEGSLFLTDYFITLAWQTPVDSEVSLGEVVVTKSKSSKKRTGATVGFETTIAKFRQTFEVVLDMYSAKTKVVPLDEGGLLTHIHSCISGLRHKINPPNIPAYLDALVGYHDFVAGIHQKIDSRHMNVVTFVGFPQEGYPEVLEALHTLPFPLRYTTRFIYLDPKDAQKPIDVYRKAWFGSRKSLGSAVGEQFTGEGTSSATGDNIDSVNMAVDAQMAQAERSEGHVKFGYFTATIVLMDEDEGVLAERTKTVEGFINNLGFTSKLETINATEAYLGSIPGHSWENVRRPLMHSFNYVDLSPKTSIWAGAQYCQSPLMKVDGKFAPPLFFAATTGSTPYRFSSHVGDVGHTLIAGPTGAGKSVLLALMAAQWLRYKDARVISFDKGMSMFALTEAVGGHHYEIAGEDSTLTFAPLKRVNESAAEREFAEDWVESLCILQGINVAADERKAIHNAIEALAKEEGRSLTDLKSLMQDKNVKNALEFNTGTGRSGSLLDARDDSLKIGSSTFTCFELEHLLTSGENAKLITVPVLLYIFMRIEQLLDGSPTLIVLDEAWVMMDNPMFMAKIKTWLKTLRKKNAAVVFATQSLEDLQKSPLLAVIKESCPTKIFLPNPYAGSQQLAPLYRDFGLEDRQIELLQTAIAKSEYYVFSDSEGHRRISLAMGPVALAFCAVSDPRDVKAVRELVKQYGARWPLEWLKVRLPSNRQDWVEYASGFFN
jgi:type IV secretion system protein VirB4